MSVHEDFTCLKYNKDKLETAQMVSFYQVSSQIEFLKFICISIRLTFCTSILLQNNEKISQAEFIHT